MKAESYLRPREMPASNFLLPLKWLGSKSDFQLANLLLTYPDFEPLFRILFTECGAKDGINGEPPASRRFMHHCANKYKPMALLCYPGKYVRHALTAIYRWLRAILL